MLLHWHHIKAKGNESVTQESSYQSLSFYLSIPISSNDPISPCFPCFPYVFPTFSHGFYPICLCSPLLVPSGPRHRALRNCSRQASRLPKGPGAAKAACSWPEGVCKVWTNLGGLFQRTKIHPWHGWWFRDPAFTSWYGQYPIIYRVDMVVEPTPLKDMSQNWIISPNFGVNIKNVWNHHLVDGSEIRRSPVDM